MFNSHTILALAVLSRITMTLAVATLVASGGAGCASDADDAAAADARPIVPLDPAGTFALRSSYSLAGPPAGAATPLAELAAATDGPDDPARYLIDRIVARLPEGRAQLVAAAVSPYLAAYVQQRIDRVAPRLADGIRTLGEGLASVARRFGTLERMSIGGSGRVHRVIHGLRFDGIEVPFAPLGLADVAATTTVVLDRDVLTWAEHGVELPYGAILRVGLDRVVVPRVVPGATDLAMALSALVDCAGLGVIASEYVGVGSPELYETACSLALTRLAAEVYERIETANARMVVAGQARVIDLDGDGPIEIIASGTWSGSVGNAPLALAIFDGVTP
jgi:hypothetical protein